MEVEERAAAANSGQGVRARAEVARAVEVVVEAGKAVAQVVK